MKDTMLSKFLYGICVIGLIVLGGIIVSLPWGINVLINISGVYLEKHYMKLLILLYVTGVPAWLIVWQTKVLAKNIIDSVPFSELSIKAIKKISLCSLFICVVYTFSLVLLPFNLSVVIIIIGGFLVALIGTILYKLVQQAMHIQDENDLTI